MEMKFLGDKTCDPLRVYNTLEPRARQEDFERSLQAEVYDPLWMLTRQWQFGELKGEDTGSAIFAKVCLETTRISKFKSGQDAPYAFEESHLLEEIVESEKPEFDYKVRLQSGLHLMRMLSRALTNVASAKMKVNLLNSFAISSPDEIDMTSDSEIFAMEKARLDANSRASQFISAVNQKAIDGAEVFSHIDGRASKTFAATILATLTELQKPLANAVAKEYVEWFRKSYGLPAEKDSSAWVDSQMEYQFACALPNETGDNTVLTASEYYNGTLDWYSFDVASNPGDDDRLDDLVPAGNLDGYVKEKTLSVIPSDARFGGMPKPRWWEFEDGGVDLGNVNAETTDIAKILSTQFALVFSNDWFVVPYAVPAGSLSRVKGIVVTDVFGQKTFVEPAIQGETDDWMAWGMFNLSTAITDKDDPMPSDTRLFFPPVVARIQEGDPVSKVNMLRDEIANYVWGVEEVVPDLLGKGMDGQTAARDYLARMHELSPPVPVVPPHEDAVLQYQLGNTVPENWIPFVPRHSGNGNRAIILQRASMPRLFENQFFQVRPRTDILRPGITRNPAKEIWPFVNEDGDTQPSPYFVHEEEVPRAGAVVSSTFQRARWYNGAVKTWFGRRKTMGRGESSSGLSYDTAKPIKR